LENWRNSILLETIIKAIHTVASRRTSSKFADESIGSSIRALEGKFDFLKHVNVRKSDPATGGFAITVAPELDGVEKGRVGKAIESLIRVVYNDMNEEAGLYFITELKEHAGDEMTTLILDNEIDLDQVQIEQHHAYRRKERKKQIEKAIKSGVPIKKVKEDLIGYNWSDVGSWKHEPGSKFCTLYDKEGNVIDRLNLDKIIENYVEKLSGYTDVDPREIEKETRIYEQEYELLKLMLEQDMDAETAQHKLDVSEDQLNNMIRKLAEMELLHYIDYDTLEITDVGIGYITKKEKFRREKKDYSYTP
jgi:hypothetical protein